MSRPSIKVGDTCDFSKTVTNEDVFNFAEVSGDKNPLHLDDEYAKTTMFGQRIAHGMIGAGIISAAIGMKMPGVGTTYLDQSLKFKAPVHIGDTLTAHIEVIDLIEKPKFDIAKLKTTCTTQDGTVVIEGEASVIPPRNAD